MHAQEANYEFDVAKSIMFAASSHLRAMRRFTVSK